MAEKVLMPKLGLNMTEGTITKWLKKEGDDVTKGEVLFTLETEKASSEAEAPADGILGRIIAQEGETVDVSSVVAVIVAEGEDVPEDFGLEAEAGEAATEEEQSETEQTAAKAGKTEPESGGRILASPVAKRLAKEHGIDLADIKTAAEGRISQEDVEHYIADQEAGGASKSIAIEGVRAVIFERMAESAHTAAAVTLHREVDASGLVEYRDRQKDEKGSAPSYNALLMQSVARALKDHPAMNAKVEGDQIKLLDQISLGLAVETERGLVVVVVPGTDELRITEIDEQVARLVEAAHAGSLSPDEMSGSTFTLTNLGNLGIDGFTPIINPPEVGILGIGRIRRVPVAVDDQVQIRPQMTLSLTFDHRVVDGAPAAEFLDRVVTAIDEL
ncbi:MAG: dihydrolipoamide acetyltransferase family protein [Anaerolineales bacterium]